MDSSNRVGPFRVRRRYRGMGPDAGRVYEAVRQDTGRPAVLAAPGPAEEWQPGSEWTARVSAGLNPPHLSLEVEKSPAGGELADLTLVLHRLTGVLARLESQPGAAAHLAGRTVARRQHRPRRVRWLLLSGNLAAALLAVLLWPAALTPELPALSWAPDGLVPVSGAVDTGGAGGVIGRDMPKKPFPGQKPAPCTPRSQVEINGVCWMPHAEMPPCPEDLVEHGGRCLAPVFTSPRTPASVLP